MKQKTIETFGHVIVTTYMVCLVEKREIILERNFVFFFVLSAGEAYVKRTSQVDSPTLWHARLGHVGYQMLQIIASNKLIDGLPKLKQVKEDVVCQGCQFGKAYKLPFKSSN